MSQVAKKLLVILGLVLFLLLAYTGYLTFQNQNLAKTKSDLDSQLEDFATRERDLTVKNKKLEDQVEAVEEAKAQIEEKLKKLEEINVEDFTKQIADLKKERDALQNKVSNFKKEREELLSKLEEKAEAEVVYKQVDAQGNELAGQRSLQEKGLEQPPSLLAKGDILEGLSENDEVYWAQVLKQKTALELEVEKLRDELSDVHVQVTELKKANSDLQLEMTKLDNEKEEIERQIKYGKDLSDSLSLELARAQNDKKFLNDRLLKINDENTGLRGQIKQLTSTKIALEKSIVRLQDEKKGVERKLSETENVIQGRIDEIWKIKKSLDDSFGPSAKENTQVELPPIVVSSGEMSGEEDPNMATSPGLNGNVVSVNNENNFVIIDIGEDQGINLGDSLNIYRGAEYIAGVEIIQVRQDIAAADIVSKVGDIKIGDAVR